MDYAEEMALTMTYCSFSFDPTKCEKCGGTGVVPIMCCNGYMCGCYGMPVEFKACDCGVKTPTEAQLRAIWNEEQDNGSN